MHDGATDASVDLNAHELSDSLDDESDLLCKLSGEFYSQDLGVNVF